MLRLTENSHFSRDGPSMPAAPWLAVQVLQFSNPHDSGLPLRLPLANEIYLSESLKADTHNPLLLEETPYRNLCLLRCDLSTLITPQSSSLQARIRVGIFLKHTQAGAHTAPCLPFIDTTTAQRFPSANAVLLAGLSCALDLLLPTGSCNILRPELIVKQQLDHDPALPMLSR
jgi:hypothetical protein